MVLMGGPSSEYEVSLTTAKNIIQALDPKKYLVKPALITKQGKWLLAPSFENPGLLENKPTDKKNLVALKSPQDIDNSVGRPDVVFIAMHGTYGEDGRVQAIFDLLDLPYTGSGVLASALGMDKHLSLLIFKEAGLIIPDFTAIDRGKKTDNKFILRTAERLSFPLVVKPANHGSSVGVNIVTNKNKLIKNGQEAFKYSNKIILQKFIKGRELTCGILEIKGKITPLPPTEIIPKLGSFYDYKSKYVEGGSRHIIPPKEISPKVIKKIQEASVLAHKIIGCSGMSRSDFILGEDDKLYILEINTIPGMTHTSLLPEEAKVAGISFPKFLDLIISNALYKKSKML